MRAQLVNNLINVGVIKHGDFLLKSGERSPIYCDFRKLVSYPTILQEVCLNLSSLFENKKNIVVAGVPMGAIPYSTCLSTMLDVPALMIRDEKKSHGTGQLIEGDYNGNDVVLIEDVVTSGGSILNTIDLLKTQQINVKEIVVILDREKGGIENIRKLTGLKVKSLFRLSELLIKPDEAVPIKREFVQMVKDLIQMKGTNLILSPDISDPEFVTGLIEDVGQYILGVKLHTDIFDPTIVPIFIQKIKELKQKFDLIIIEDRKFSDIGSIVSKQVSIIKDWADIVTAHTVTGEEMIRALNDANIGILPIHQLSTKDNLIDSKYSLITKNMVVKYENVIGFITQESVIDGLLNFSPGVNLDVSADNYGQRYNTPEYMKKNGTDIFIIGRGIYESPDPIASCIRYRDACRKN